MDAFTRRIDPEESFDIGDDAANSFDMISSSMTSSASSMSFGPHVPGGAGSEPDSEDPSKSQGQLVNSADPEMSNQPQSSNKRRPVYEAPEFTHRLNVFEEVDIGGTVTFECQVRAFPHAIIKWYKDDVEVPSPSSALDNAADTVDRVQSVDLTGTDSSSDGLLRLVISDARKEDEGAYRCKAENEEGVAATTGYLSVTGPATNGSQQQGSPRINAVSTPPLLRAITEQQSMEEREAASYVVDDENVDEGSQVSIPDVPVLSSVGDWSTYSEYLQHAIDDDDSIVRAAGQHLSPETGSGSDTSLELDDVVDDLKIIEHDTEPTVAATTSSSLSTTKIQTDAANSRSSAAATENGSNNGDDDVTMSMVNVVTVEGYDPDEFTVSTVVIGRGVDDPETEPPTSSAPIDDQMVTSAAAAAAEYYGPMPAAAAQGDGAGFQPTTVDGPPPLLLPELSSATPGAGDSPAFHSEVNGDVPVDLVQILPTIDDHQPAAPDCCSKPTASVASSVVADWPQRPDVSPAVDNRTVSTKMDSKKSDEPDNDVRCGSASAVKDGKRNVGGLLSDRSLSLGGLVRDLFTGSAKTEKPAVVNESESKPVTSGQEVSRETVSDTVEGIGGGSVDQRFNRKGVDLTWSSVYDWYIGWFEMPWLAYLVLAIVCTLAAEIAQADPVWVVIGVLVASMFTFLLFPVPVVPTAGRS